MQYNFEPLTKPVTSKDFINYKNPVAIKQKAYSKSRRAMIIVMFILFVGIILALLVSEASKIIASGNYVQLVVNIVVIGFQIAIPLTIIVIFAFVFMRRMATQNIKLTRFAEANNLIYQRETANLNLNYPGMIFQIGKMHRYQDRLRDSTGNLFEISNYSYSDGSGENGYRENGYIMIKLNRRLPNIVLDSNNKLVSSGLISSNLPISFKNNQKLTLEGDFNKYFSLYVPEAYERDALYVFTPDLMALFIDNSSVFTAAEIIEDRLFIYSNRFDMTDPVVLGQIFKIIDTIGKKAISQTDSYADERVGDRSINVVTSDGSRLKKRFASIGVAVFIILLFFIIIFNYLLITR